MRDVKIVANNQRTLKNVGQKAEQEKCQRIELDLPNSKQKVPEDRIEFSIMTGLDASAQNGDSEAVQMNQVYGPATATN